MTKNKNVGIFTILAVLGSLVLTPAFAYTMINSELDLGERNTDVTSLQGFFADNSAIYPEGIVTGYFGGLTKSAVQRFQAQYGLDQVGRVGPLTRQRINTLISQGGWVVTDMSGPWISSVGSTINNTSVTFTWNTNELASAKVFYHTSPISMNEGDINSLGFGSTNGMSSTNDGLVRSSQQITLTNLHPNTTYYYVVVATDLKGNVSVWNPNTTFRTSN
jgi:hypothetical protein